MDKKYLIFFGALFSILMFMAIMSENIPEGNINLFTYFKSFVIKNWVPILIGLIGAMITLILNKKKDEN